jgi:hypothetical protein
VSAAIQSVSLLVHAERRSYDCETCFSRVTGDDAVVCVLVARGAGVEVREDHCRGCVGHAVARSLLGVPVPCEAPVALDEPALCPECSQPLRELVSPTGESSHVHVCSDIEDELVAIEVAALERVRDRSC